MHLEMQTWEKLLFFCICYFFMFIALQSSDLAVLECFHGNYVHLTISTMRVSYVTSEAILDKIFASSLEKLSKTSQRDGTGNIIRFLNTSFSHLSNKKIFHAKLTEQS